MRFIEHVAGIQISFLQWKLIGVPAMLTLLPIAWFLNTTLLFPTRMKEIEGGRDYVREQWSKLGPLSRAERATLAIFGMAVALWMTAPVLVLLCYVICPAPMDRQLWPDAVVMVLVATLTATLVTSSGRSAWFVGVLLLPVYLIFAMTLYLLPPRGALHWAGASQDGEPAFAQSDRGQTNHSARLRDDGRPAASVGLKG